MSLEKRTRTVSAETPEELAECVAQWKAQGWREASPPRRALTLRREVWEQDIQRISSRNPLAGQTGARVAWFR